MRPSQRGSDDASTRSVPLSSAKTSTKAVTAELVAYLAQEVLPHAVAEERTIYQAAATKADLAQTVAGMVDEHRQLGSLTERLATAGDGVAAVAAATAIGTLFAGHVVKENELLLPALAADTEADLAGLLVEMHRLTESARDDAQDETPVTEPVTPTDVEASLLRLALDATSQLAAAGHGEVACRLAAEAWAVVRVARPELAVRALNC
jgi:iron-sulfur cluster repair protein YtfE (RIC family)